MVYFPSSQDAFDFADIIAHPPPPPHNIFDISAPPFPLPHLPDYTHPTHFNSTLPALNSSLRYDNPPSPPRPSRSPSLGPRRTRTTRKHSISSLSPPPRPTAILIPGSRHPTSHHNNHGSPLPIQPWFVPSQNHTTPHEYSLPTPDSLTHPFSASPFPLGISPSDVQSPLSPPTPTSTAHHPHLAPSPTASAPHPDDAKQAEKRRRRRESHNAVERRRRDNINEKITELATLIPECMLDPSAPATSANGNGASSSPPPASVDPSAAADIFASLTDSKRSASGDDPDTPSAPDPGAVKANKGMILRKSVDYIRFLQQLVAAQAARNRELEAQLAAARAGAPPSALLPAPHPPPLSSPSSAGSARASSPASAASASPALVLALPAPAPDDDDDPEGAFMNFDPLRMGVPAGFRGVGGAFGAFAPAPADAAAANGIAAFAGGMLPLAAFELASMPEDMEVEDPPAPPPAAAAAAAAGRPASASPAPRAARARTRSFRAGRLAQVVEEEEARGRRGRDGRIGPAPGDAGAAPAAAVKVEDAQEGGAGAGLDGRADGGGGGREGAEGEAPRGEAMET